jgi:hypothetical protein
MVSRQKYPYPIISQALFGLSFVLFLYFLDKIAVRRTLWVWLWTLAQVVLGVFLVRGRMRARKRVLRCIRCGQDLP